MSATSNDDTLQVGQYKTIFEVVLVENGAIVDISTATAMEIRLKKPSGKTLIKVAVFSTDGTDGRFEYESILGDIDQPGSWRIQGGVTLPSWVGMSSIGEFEVEPNL